MVTEKRWERGVPSFLFSHFSHSPYLFSPLERLRYQIPQAIFSAAFCRGNMPQLWLKGSLPCNKMLGKNRLRTVKMSQFLAGLTSA